MLLKITGKIFQTVTHVLFHLFYRLNGYIIHIVIVTSLTLLLSPYYPSNRDNMNIDGIK